MSIPGERSRVDVHMERLKEARKYCHHCTGEAQPSAQPSMHWQVLPATGTFPLTRFL